ncbi:Trafficking protein particle complex subunit 2-like protein, partial [Drosera capensis]
VNNPKKSGPLLNETFLGLLYPTENYKVYGYLTNTKVKFILVTTDLDVRDADVRSFFKKFHAAYVDAVSNPFHVPGKKITSRTFAERSRRFVQVTTTNLWRPKAVARPATPPPIITISAVITLSSSPPIVFLLASLDEVNRDFFLM